MSSNRGQNRARNCWQGEGASQTEDTSKNPSPKKMPNVDDQAHDVKQRKEDSRNGTDALVKRARLPPIATRQTREGSPPTHGNSEGGGSTKADGPGSSIRKEGSQVNIRNSTEEKEEGRQRNRGTAVEENSINNCNSDNTTPSRELSREWICQACTSRNAHKALQCSVCKTPKEDDDDPPNLQATVKMALHSSTSSKGYSDAFKVMDKAGSINSPRDAKDDSSVPNNDQYTYNGSTNYNYNYGEKSQAARSDDSSLNVDADTKFLLSLGQRSQFEKLDVKGVQRWLQVAVRHKQIGLPADVAKAASPEEMCGRDILTASDGALMQMLGTLG
eukprot:jgi/Bigna1/131621/aug1.15_g6329